MNFITGIILGCFIVIAIHLFITKYYKRKLFNIDVEQEIERILTNKEINVGVNVKDKAKASYNCEDKIITFSKGNSFLSITEAFHELGHAIDDKDIVHKKFGILEFLLFYLLKYSVPVAIVLYIIQTQMDNRDLIIPIFISIALGIFFFFGTLIDELKATYFAIKELRENLSLTKKEMIHIKICLFAGLLSYITLCLLVLILLIAEIIYII